MIRQFISLILVSSFLLLLFCSKVANLVRPLIVPESDEITMGEKFKAQILADTVNYPVYKKENALAIHGFVDSLGQHLATVQDDWKNDNLKFTFTVIDNDSMINAFAVPGGHIFVYTGLMLNAVNTAQLEGVLAHEIGHITMHHSANTIVKQYGISFVNQIVFGSDSSAANAIASLLEGMMFLKMSRNDEYQADSCAVAYTSEGGINPVGMKEFLGVLASKYGADNARILEPVETALSTHPPLSERIENVQRLVDKIAPNSSTVDKRQTEYEKIRALIK